MDCTQWCYKTSKEKLNEIQLEIINVKSNVKHAIREPIICHKQE